ncbi:hypothetical protein NW754_014574 [Fusarium falciforme]|nr:hypothetical protein NW754_014574 [Fusarium falciforme]KAJ4185977.1 hypothetical protein NW767_012715 [Fusarium falciforme]KAJ4236843.1 hypothetical protein NW757_013342 [Fusarium falciforme]
MVAVRPLLVLSMVAGIAVAGKCRPSSSISASTETSLTTLATETTVTESSTESVTVSTTETTIDTATETSSTETTISPTTESTAETTTGSTTDTTLTTFTTSLSATETTTEAATTTSEAAVVVTCPSTGQCLHTMNIMCDYIIGGIPYDDELSLNDCAHKCDNNPSCALFVHDSSSNYCYTTSSTDQIRGEGLVPGWASGVKGRCGQ